MSVERHKLNGYGRTAVAKARARGIVSPRPRPVVKSLDDPAGSDPAVMATLADIDARLEKVEETQIGPDALAPLLKAVLVAVASLRAEQARPIQVTIPDGAVVVKVALAPAKSRARKVVRDERGRIAAVKDMEE